MEESWDDADDPDGRVETDGPSSCAAACAVITQRAFEDCLPPLGAAIPHSRASVRRRRRAEPTPVPSFLPPADLVEDLRRVAVELSQDLKPQVVGDKLAPPSEGGVGGNVGMDWVLVVGGGVEILSLGS